MRVFGLLGKPEIAVGARDDDDRHEVRCGYGECGDHAVGRNSADGTDGAGREPEIPVRPGGDALAAPLRKGDGRPTTAWAPTSEAKPIARTVSNGRELPGDDRLSGPRTSIAFSWPVLREQDPCSWCLHVLQRDATPLACAKDQGFPAFFRIFRRRIIRASPCAAAIPIFGTSTGRKGANDVRNSAGSGSLSSIPQIVAAKGRERIAMMTAYDAPTAALLDAAGVDVLLVGDSVEMVIYGEPNDADRDDGLDDPPHARPSRARPSAPSSSATCPSSRTTAEPARAVENAGRFVAEGGAAAGEARGRPPRPSGRSRRSSPPTSR